MSDRNLVALVRRIYDEWGRGNFRAGTDLYDHNVMVVIRPEFLDPGVYTGADQLATYMHNFLEPWGVITIGAEDIRPVGDSVLVRVVQRGTGRTSGVETELRYFQLWTFRGGRVIRIESISDADEACEAAGLPAMEPTAHNEPRS
jgi:ketosteroid isomerase-like protein